MNLRNWSKHHTFGVLIGVLTPLICIPIVLFVLSWVQNYDFSRLWHEFTHFDQYQIKIITMSIISNLIWFYYFLNKEKYNFAMGVILGSIAFAPYVIYVKFF